MSVSILVLRPPSERSFSIPALYDAVLQLSGTVSVVTPEMPILPYFTLCCITLKRASALQAVCIPCSTLCLMLFLGLEKRDRVKCKWREPDELLQVKCCSETPEWLCVVSSQHTMYFFPLMCLSLPSFWIVWSWIHKRLTVLQCKYSLMQMFTHPWSSNILLKTKNILLKKNVFIQILKHSFYAFAEFWKYIQKWCIEV